MTPLLALAASLFFGTDVLVSGPQVGDKLPGGLDPVPLNLTTGKRNDFVEQFGADPVVLVFARRLSDPLADLMKKLDADKTRFKVVVVLISTEQKVMGPFERLNLATMPVAPKGYGVSPEADVTVVAYKR